MLPLPVRDACADELFWRKKRKNECAGDTPAAQRILRGTFTRRESLYQIHTAPPLLRST